MSITINCDLCGDQCEDGHYSLYLSSSSQGTDTVDLCQRCKQTIDNVGPEDEAIHWKARALILGSFSDIVAVQREEATRG